jgi:hypothetical protein
VTTRPNLDELLDGVQSPAERERLQRVHELLLEAGPPPELTPALATSPEATDLDDGDFGWLPRRRWRAGVVLAFAAMAAAFGIGYLTGSDEAQDAFPVDRVVALRPTEIGTPAAQGSIRLGRADADGNSPMLLTVRGLPKLGRDGYYELLFTQNGKVVGPCGNFMADAGTTEIYLNAPYEVDARSGWAVAVHPEGHVDDPRIVLRT